MRIHFCGLARDCANTLRNNLDNIIRIGEDDRIDEYKIWIAENDSKDETKEILRSYEKKEKIELYNYDGLDEQIEDRVNRISHLRQKLLDKVKRYTKSKKHNTIYCPVDLDSDIAGSVDLDTFISECERVLSGRVNAIFPASEPYYYDIYALRKEGWVENNCWGAVNREKYKFGSFIAKYRNIYSKHIPVEDTTEGERIKVKSAFGGLGIYRFLSIKDISYEENSSRNSQEKIMVCEHVDFNMQISEKEISNELIVKAPDEHISFKLKSRYGKISYFLRSVVTDTIKILKAIL